MGHCPKMVANEITGAYYRAFREGHVLIDIEDNKKHRLPDFYGYTPPDSINGSAFYVVQSLSNGGERILG